MTANWIYLPFVQGMTMNYNIYYHFFDRELRKSVNAIVEDEELLSVCCLSVFMSNNTLYLPISNLYESGDEFPKTAEFIKNMDKAGLLFPASSHETREGFIFSRREYYSHDQKRYPMYFEEDNNMWSSNLIYLENSTTKQLENRLQNDSIDIKELNGKSRDEVKKFIDKVFARRQQKAITTALFTNKPNSKSKLSDSEMRITLEYIKYKISLNYTRRYLEICDGTIITGIPGIQKYDFLSKDKFDTNYPIYQIIFKKCSLDTKYEENRKLLFNIRTDYPLYRSIYIKIKEIIALLKTNVHISAYMGQEIKNILDISTNYPKVTSGFDLYSNLERYIEDIILYNNFAKEGIHMKNNGSIVLIAVTTKEMKAMIKKAREYFPSNMIIEKVGPKLVYRELINEKQKVYFVQSEMGNVGVGSMVNTVHLVCEEFNPKYIIMGGIAFGSDPQKQNIGEILVSKQVWYYERAKMVEKVTLDRGDKIPASAWLLRLFRSSELEYEKTKIHFGLIASGEKLVNSSEIMDNLKMREPELIGGDMEVAGLASVCEEKKIEWILAKAICDWGMNKSNIEQMEAAENAFDFIMYNLQKLI